MSPKAVSANARATAAPLTRVVACQGAVQLASAVAAMWATSGRSSERVGPTENHLIIHDLSAPAGQDLEFANCIHALARKVETWASITYKPLNEVVELQAELAKQTKTAAEKLQRLVGVESCDELFVGQNNKALPTWLVQATPNAKHICFGDGIAMNFTNDYYRPHSEKAEKRHSTVKQTLRKLVRYVKELVRGKKLKLCDSKFDHHCLLLKNLFDQHVERVIDLTGETFKELFDSFGKDFDKQVPCLHRHLQSVANSGNEVVFLLTSNFSETCRMSLEAELDGYAELLSRLPQGPETTLIVKPHPRDSHEKIARLMDAMSDRYGNETALSDPWTFYLPFESLYSKYFASDSNAKSKVHVATVSSACISLEYLYGQACSLGFGAAVVDNSFVPMWQERRKVHEVDLQKIIYRIRSQQRYKGTQKAAA
jgi:hypothetical protein